MVLMRFLARGLLRKIALLVQDGPAVGDLSAEDLLMSSPNFQRLGIGLLIHPPGEGLLALK